MYQLRSPAPALASYVEHYWFVTHPDGQPVSLHVDVFVDGRADLIVNHGVEYQREVIGGASEQVKFSNVDAQRLVPIRISQHGLVDIAGVRFELGGLGAFVRSPLAQWTGKTPTIDEVFGSDASALERALAETDDLEAKTLLLDGFLLSRLEAQGRYRDFREQLAKLADPLDGTVPTGGSATERQDRARLFARYLGIPPRTVARIVRFQRTLRTLMSDPGGSLSDLASHAGYFDQAHFVRDFREMTGGVPRGYRGYFPLEAPTDFAPNVVTYVQDA